ncbi:MAG: uroporphyrinogen decarboxylase [candidate division Zixibacteria bacterium]|nr:uroporphyrinogen decarboxylase [candidate division Zixibacteria bacterium]
MGLNDSTFLEACWGRNSGRIPVWIMRQAGRYLPEYRQLRERVSFTQLCKSPELIADVVAQPIDRFGLDAAILFSDILIPLEPLGVGVSFPEGGPVLASRITSPADVDRLQTYDIATHLPFVLDGIRAIKKRMPNVPVIGFAGSPFTLACYLIEGKGSRNFDGVKQFMHCHPEAAERLIDLLADLMSAYLSAQLDAGADAVQLFCSWDGILSKDDFYDWTVRPARRIFGALKSRQAPRILFVNNIAPYLDVVGEVDCEVLSVDYRIDLGKVARALPNRALQGNLDPSALFESVPRVIERTQQILDALERHDNLIFNLGHGIQPATPIEAVQAVVETVHGYRRQS